MISEALKGMMLGAFSVGILSGAIMTWMATNYQKRLRDIMANKGVVDIKEHAFVQHIKSKAYWERNQLVCLLSKIFPSHIEHHPDDGKWDPEYKSIVYIHLPTGQVTWHIHESELENFKHLKFRDGNSWDGHKTAEKYRRISAVGEE